MPTITESLSRLSTINWNETQNSSICTQTMR